LQARSLPMQMLRCHGCPVAVVQTHTVTPSPWHPPAVCNSTLQHCRASSLPSLDPSFPQLGRIPIRPCATTIPIRREGRGAGAVGIGLTMAILSAWLCGDSFGSCRILWRAVAESRVCLEEMAKRDNSNLEVMTGRSKESLQVAAPLPLLMARMAIPGGR